MFRKFLLILMILFCFNLSAWEEEDEFDFEMEPLTDAEVDEIVRRYDDALQRRREMNAPSEGYRQPAYNPEPSSERYTPSVPDRSDSPPARSSSPFGGRFSEPSSRGRARISDSLYQGTPQGSVAYYRFTTTPDPLAILQEYEPETKTCTKCNRSFGAEFSFCPFCALPLQGQAASDTGNTSVLRFVPIAPGTFYMGATPNEPLYRDNEHHRRPVRLTKPFEISITEVTQRQWQLVMGYYESEWEDFDLPVQRISWEDVQKFLKILNEAQAEYFFRLPTEAEWEYAARGGVDEPYHFGADSSLLSDYAWFRSNSGRRPRPVAQKKPNPYGLYDMNGNVWEWVQDWYQEQFPAQPQTDPQGPLTGEEKVYKGGGWASTTSCRSVSRASLSPKYGMNEVGFRIVREVRLRR
jgi:formylglycine-generating enzyme required for sulfatase activity